MKEASRKLLDKAGESILAAAVLLKNKHTLFAVSRAYYAMFYTAEALLYEKDLTFSKHSGVQSAFGKHFVKTGIFEPEFHRALLKA